MNQIVLSFKERDERFDVSMNQADFFMNGIQAGFALQRHKVIVRIKSPVCLNFQFLLKIQGFLETLERLRTKTQAEVSSFIRYSLNHVHQFSYTHL